MTDNIEDIGKRVSDTYNLHRLADDDGNIGQWFAVALEDGRSDGHVYSSKASCVKAQKHNEMYYAFIQIGPWQMPASEAEDFIKIQRKLYSMGLRIADPETGGRDLIRRISRADQHAQTRAMLGQGRPTNIRYGVN